MSLDKIDFFYNGKGFHDFQENHYEVFAKALLKRVKHHNDFLITQNWDNIRENSLIIAYDYEGLHDDLSSVVKGNIHEFYRRVFVINWRFLAHLDSPRHYQRKSFVGSLFNRSYRVITEGRNVSLDYADFYGDSLALENLRTDTSGQWRVNIVYEIGMYEKVYCGIDILQVLGTYLEEYMEKYDSLKHLDKFAENHQRPQ